MRYIITTFGVLIGCFLGTKVLECEEGHHNKALILTMDNGLEIVARLPCPVAGPPFYTTASEVATRSFVGHVPR